jgi:hypothetical protein
LRHAARIACAPPPAGETQWTESVLHSFMGESDGGDPVAGLIVGEQGALYGASSAEGSPNCLGGCGTVFRQCSVEGGEISGDKSNLRYLRW